MTLLEKSRRSTMIGFGRVGLLALIPALVVATACGSDSDSDSGDSNSGSETSVSFPSNPATGSPIKIGVINPVGGPAISQPNNRKAAEAAAKYANESLAGIAGHPVDPRR